MKTLMVWKTCLEANWHLLLFSFGFLIVIPWPRHFPAGNVSLWSSAHSAVSSWCQTVLFAASFQALPVSHCHRDSVCLLESLQRCAHSSPGVAGEGRPWADLELGVPWREFCAQVQVYVSVQKGSRLQKYSTTEMSSWGPAKRLQELIPNALGHLRHFC